MSPYAVSKQATEGYALAYGFSYGMKTLAFRFFNVFGPGQAAGHAYAAVIPKFVEAALDGDALRVHGDGTQSRDFTYVKTVCDVLYESVLSQVHAQDPVNLAYGTQTTLLELISLLEELLGRHLETHMDDPRVGDVRASQADGHRVRELFPGIEPTALLPALEETLAWYVDHRNATGSA